MAGNGHEPDGEREREREREEVVGNCLKEQGELPTYNPSSALVPEPQGPTMRIPCANPTGTVGRLPARSSGHVR